jgi:hypothetical protein
MAHDKYRSCIQACNECAAECDHCATACLDEDNPKQMARCIRLDLDCARICRLAAAAMAADSEFVTEICRLCSEICRACGEECRGHEPEHCQSCARACEKCGDECDRMVTADV